MGQFKSKLIHALVNLAYAIVFVFGVGLIILDGFGWIKNL